MPFTKEERTKLKAERFRAEQAEALNYAEDGNSLQGDIEEDTSSEGMKPCCVPLGCCVELVNTLNADDVEKVICNNADCTYGEYMHKSCFQAWEDEVLTYLRSSGRARSWSEKQRRQNLWTKKGYDLAWKACSCQCTKGHLRKDLDWIPPKQVVAEAEESVQRRQRRRKKSSDKPSIGKATMLPAIPHGGHSGRHRHTSASSSENHTPPHSPVVRSDSFSSPSQSPHSANTLPSHIQQHSRSRHHSGNNNKDSFDWPTSTARQCSVKEDGIKTNIGELNSPVSGGLGLLPGQQLIEKNEGTSCSNAIVQCQNQELKKATSGNPHSPSMQVTFVHRMDLSTFFKMLPRQKCNPYHIKMDDDNGSDCDEVRGFIFSALSAHGITTMICSLCQNRLPVFDGYPLLDGTFYLSPLNHSDVNLRLVLNGRVQYLVAVCMQCLEGVKRIVCRICKSRWDGSHHQLGTLYSYDIFAASPCCPGRVSCKNCGKQVIDPTRGTHFFSDYSQSIQCPHCGIPDFHFVKPLSNYEVLLREINTC